ncbi:hypothetical protein RCL_jg4847.t1 [Rhizophagus clarus]|uniref:Uncharacterized protein n=1 Tax=Rhizophagus clarus TaxID=94130 RepID=A0A8H3MLD3_9GLOM|nr:hypothetical protein RCL_jg4847.t1 [Rhizophagus clarus]
MVVIIKFFAWHPLPMYSTSVKRIYNSSQNRNPSLNFDKINIVFIQNVCIFKGTPLTLIIKNSVLDLIKLSVLNQHHTKELLYKESDSSFKCYWNYEPGN